MSWQAHLSETRTGNFHGLGTGDNSDETLYIVHESPVVRTYDSPLVGTCEIRWSLSVCSCGVVSTTRTVPYNGTRTYSTEDLPNRADKSSRYQLSRERVLEKHAAECEHLGGDVAVDELRESMLAVLRREDVATNGTSGVDLLAGGE